MIGMLSRTVSNASGTCLVRSLAVAAALTLLPRCQTSTASGPGGTDFPNTRTVAGRILHEDGTPASFTEIRLIPRDFVPGTDGARNADPVDFTDSSGRFAIGIADSGTFNLTARHLHRRTLLLLRNLSPTDDDTVKTGDRTLRAPGALSVALPDSLQHTPGFLYIRGTTLRTPVDASSAVMVLDSLPAGVVPPVCFIRANAAAPGVVLSDSAIVTPSDTVLVAPQRGRFSLRLFLNTTVSGADVAEDVRNVPIAIRFGNLPIDMTELAPDGTDLRVTRNDNTPLPCHIEQWEPDRARALVWAKIDTIYGNRAGQSIYLFWGNADAARASDTPVFDTADGFSAVWHLSGSCTDATINGHDGATTGGVTDTAGILGNAQHFHGNDHIGIPGLLGKPATVMLSAWARLDTPDSTGGEVVSIGDAVVIRMDDGWNNKGCQGSYFSSPAAPDTSTHDYLASGKFLAGSGWHFLAYVYDAAQSEHRFYIDGELHGRKTVFSPIRYDGVGGDTKIGTHGNGKTFRNFTGSIDEVCVARTARSSAWIKLCYMNQRTDDKLISLNRK